MKAQHTPGPWNVNKKVKTSIEQTIAGQGMNLICQCEDPDGERTREENEANARLIAAAPELLEALQEELKEREEWNGLGNHTERIKQLKALINKATQP